VAGAIFGDVAALLFVAGAVFGEIWIDSQSAKFCNFLTKCVADGEKVSSANGRVQFCNFMFGSWGDHAQVVRHCKARFICFSADCLHNFGMSFRVAGAVFGDVGGRVLLS